MASWDNQKRLQENRIPTVLEIIEMAESIQSDRNRALFILTYWTAGRIGELTKYTDYVKQKFKSGLLKKDLTRTEKDGRPIFLIHMRNQKNKKRMIKEIPIPLDKQDNQKLFNLIIDHLNDIGDSEELFPITTRRAETILKKETGFNPHWLRHIRLTHLVTEYDFSEMDLMMFAGWTDPRPAKHYMELRWGDFLRKM